MDVDKVLAEVGGLPVIVRCLQSFQQAPGVVYFTPHRKKEPFGPSRSLMAQQAVDAALHRVIRQALGQYQFGDENLLGCLWEIWW